MLKNKRRVFCIILILIVLVSFLSITITTLYIKTHEDKEYEKLELGIKDYDIDYYTIYSKDNSYEYKVYKINNSHDKDSIYRIKKRIKNNKNWNKKKFYEYIMNKFYEKIDRKSVEIDREDLYYYNKGLIYAIMDVKNAKLYYLKNNVIDYHNNYKQVLDIKVDDYKDIEIYNVKGQDAQNDGIDYYTYVFDEEKCNQIKKEIIKNNNWSTKQIDQKILKKFEHNIEILSIKNGYYYYKENNISANTNKKETKYEVGVYDCDNNILYYLSY